MKTYPSRVFALLACAAAVFSAGCEIWSDSSEEISDFYITMDFREDGSVEVEERIVVAVQHDKLKDGMHRALWSSQPGNTFKVEPIGGEIDGEKCVFKTQLKNGRFRMRASLEGELSVGKHEFCYRYKVTRIVRQGNSGEKAIRWNLTGRRWPWGIDVCDVLLRFHKGVDPATIRAEIRHTRGGGKIEKVAGSGLSMSFRNDKRVQDGDSLLLKALWAGAP
tara:strand:+ start:94 stop:756 length:663 start_codon:yes stop_codon:yes gene_type:complete